MDVSSQSHALAAVWLWERAHSTHWIWG